MTDKDPSEGNTPETNKSKLPPRRADWHSGLKREDNDSYRPTADGTVSDFLATQRNPDSPDWDPIDGPRATGEIAGRADVSAVDPVSTKPVTMGFYQRRMRFTDMVIALLVGLAAFFAVATTYVGFGHSWDEALYLKPAERAAAWMLGVINSGDDSMLQPAAVGRHWGHSLDGNDPLHPEIAPIPKLLIGAGLTYLVPLGIEPMVAMRLPVAVLFALTVALLFLLGTREYGRIGGFAAALMYFMMPRVFGHAHIAASETALAFFVVLTVWCFLTANRFWVLALFTGIAFGLAVDTKVTALMLPLPLMVWGQIYKRREYASNIFAMAFVAPVVIIALWPWLWYDGLSRFFSYLEFYTSHQSTAVYYLGRKWGYTHGPNAPFFYPLHIAAISIPIWILAFLALGLLRALFSTIRRPVTILFVVMAAAWLGLNMLPHAPRYDGERLFFPAFAFLALTAAGGFSALFMGVHGWRERRGGVGARRETGYIAAIAVGICAVYGAVDLYFSHPNQLNYYNWLVGRSAGAYAQGFETSYWGEAVNEDVTDYLNTVLQPGDKVKTLALNDLAFENLRQWNKLPEKVDFSPDASPYDYVVMQVRQGFMGRPERQLLRNHKPLREFSHNGVPRILVYAGADVGSIFPTIAKVAVQAEIGVQLKDEESTATMPADVLTTQTPAINDKISVSAEKVDAGTTATEALELPEEAVTTASAVTAMDDLSTASAITSNGLETSAVMVLDLPTSNSETTATEKRLTPVPLVELMEAGDPETSASRIYDGDLPSTNSLPTVVE